MPIPIMPIAGAVLKYGPAAAAIVATVAYAKAKPRNLDQRTEDMMDTVEDGFDISRAPDGRQVNSTGRYRRVIRVPGGMGVEVDASLIGRLRVRRVH